MQEPTPRIPEKFRVGEWQVHAGLNRLRFKGETVRVTPRAMRVLCELAGSAPEPVSRSCLIESVWTQANVGDEALTHVISALRKALGDDPRRPRYIQTIPKGGYRLIADVAPLPDETRSFSSTGRHSGERGWRSPSVRPVGVLALAAALATIAMLASLWKPAPDPDPPGPVPVTSLPGSESWPALSPDGRRIAFEWHSDIFLKLIGDDSLTRLTETSAQDHGPAWSADGTHIAFSRTSESSCSIHVAVVLSRQERKVADCGANSLPDLSWHPSGDWLAFSDSEAPLGGYAIHIVSLETNRRHPLFPEAPLRLDVNDILPAFSPDGSQLAFARSGLGATAIYAVRLEHPTPAPVGEPKLIYAPAADVEGFDWTADGRGIVFSSVRDGNSALWRIEASGRNLVPLAYGGFGAVQPSISRQGARLAFARRDIEINIWEANPDGDEKTPMPHPSILSSRIDFNPQLSPDGRHLAFVSTRSGSAQIWTSSGDSADPVRRTNGDWLIAATPAWSPNGKEIAFSARKGESLDLYRFSLAGGAPVQLTRNSAHDGDPSYSRDGRWIFFTSDSSGDFEIWKMPSAGGPPKQVTRGGGVAPNTSCDGRFVYYSKLDQAGIWRIEEKSKAVEQVMDLLHPRDWNNWALAPDGIYFVERSPDQSASIAYFSFEDGEVTERIEPSGDIGKDLAGGLTAARTGSFRTILYAQKDRDESDVMLLEGFR